MKTLIVIDMTDVEGKILEENKTNLSAMHCQQVQYSRDHKCPVLVKIHERFNADAHGHFITHTFTSDVVLVNTEIKVGEVDFGLELLFANIQLFWYEQKREQLLSHPLRKEHEWGQQEIDKFFIHLLCC